MSARDVVASATARHVRATEDPAMWDQMDDDERRYYLGEADAALAALSTAGFAVVELPDLTRLSCGRFPEWEQEGKPAASTGWPTGWVVWTAREPRALIMVQRVEPGELTPNQARDLAAALLAAAEHAEAGQ